jgi:hypothetical protein
MTAQQVIAGQAVLQHLGQLAAAARPHGLLEAADGYDFTGCGVLRDPRPFADVQLLEQQQQQPLA